jgi:hypothetical protein
VCAVVSLTIRLDDTTDWGCQGSDDEREYYEEQVADGIRAAYPGADVTVQNEQRRRPRVVVTTRDAQGRILTDTTTQTEEASIEEHVLAIAAEVWDAGEFWSVDEVEGAYPLLVSVS